MFSSLNSRIKHYSYLANNSLTYKLLDVVNEILIWMVIKVSYMRLMKVKPWRSRPRHRAFHRKYFPGI